MIRGIPHPIEIFVGGNVGLACGPNGDVAADELHGMFAGDTRVLSTYRLAIAGHGWRLLARTRPGPSVAQWDMQNPMIRAPSGDIEEGMIHCRLRRHVLGCLHDDLMVTSFLPKATVIRLTVQIDADFADVFEVKSRSMAPRLAVQRVLTSHGIRLAYDHDGFRRGLAVEFRADPCRTTFVGNRVVFDLMLEPRRAWCCCVEAVPEIAGKTSEFRGDPHGDPAPSVGASKPSISAPSILSRPFAAGRADLERLAMTDGTEPPYIAAGAPWFMALFGRDTLVTSLMAGLIGSWHARGCLAALARTQSHRRDSYRDAEPGKIAHELRHGELAYFDRVPHTPYYGTHDAPALYVLALWNAYRFTGDRTLIERYLEPALAALRWCDELGDEDGDGLLEYRARSSQGYRNQAWKDAGDAIPHEEGDLAEAPIATVELQGYWYAARLAMAELLESVGDNARALRFRVAAKELRQRIEDRFWMEDVGFYALALDGKKRMVRSIASNAGHLLWCGVPRPERARRVAERLFESDMFSGHGVRTLSTHHCRYNPLSYQLGSVWPHDNALLAAGLVRYSQRDHAARLLEGLLSAASAFEGERLPELFCGFPRESGGPVPYEKANVPQAWAAAVPILVAQIFLGLVPDVPNRRCHLSPWLPKWLPRLELTGVPIGDGTMNVTVVRSGAVTRIERAEHPSLEMVEACPVAPLWGAPFR